MALGECDEYLFLTEYEYRILFGFQKEPNTEYWIVFGIEKIRIVNTEYYSVMRKSEYRMQKVWFGLTIWIPKTKYRIAYKVLGKKSTKINIFVSYKTFCSENLWNYSDRYLVGYSNTRILFGVPKKLILNTKYYSVLRKYEYKILKYQILLFGPTIQIIFKYRIICHTLGCSIPNKSHLINTTMFQRFKCLVL